MQASLNTKSLSTKPDFEQCMHRIDAWLATPIFMPASIALQPDAIRKAGKSLVIDLQLQELEPFMQEMKPEGIFLCLDVEPALQQDVIRRVERW